MRQARHDGQGKYPTHPHLLTMYLLNEFVENGGGIAALHFNIK